MTLKAECLQDVKDLVKDFLIVNKTGVSLKNICQLTTNECNSTIDSKGMYNFLVKYYFYLVFNKKKN